MNFPSPFPNSTEEFISLGLNTRPVFFGCDGAHNASEQFPYVLSLSPSIEKRSLLSRTRPHSMDPEQRPWKHHQLCNFHASNLNREPNRDIRPQLPPRLARLRQLHRSQPHGVRSPMGNLRRVRGGRTCSRAARPSAHACMRGVLHPILLHRRPEGVCIGSSS